MQKVKAIFNYQTLIVCVLAFVSSYISLTYKIEFYVDFLIIGLVIVFPLTLITREAFKRRERALRSFSRYKGTTLSIFYALQTSKLDDPQKEEFKNVMQRLSDKLLNYLKQEGEQIQAKEVLLASESIFSFIALHRNILKKDAAQKIYLYLFRVNESLEFLLATKRHRTPLGLRLIVLMSVYFFVVFYPSTLLGKVGFDAPLWYVFLMTGFKGFLLITLYNVQSLLEDPFKQIGPDNIRLEDFAFAGFLHPDANPKPLKLKVDEDDATNSDNP